MVAGVGGEMVFFLLLLLCVTAGLFVSVRMQCVVDGVCACGYVAFLIVSFVRYIVDDVCAVCWCWYVCSCLQSICCLCLCNAL